MQASTNAPTFSRRRSAVDRFQVVGVRLASVHLPSDTELVGMPRHLIASSFGRLIPTGDATTDVRLKLVEGSDVVSGVQYEVKSGRAWPDSGRPMTRAGCSRDVSEALSASNLSAEPDSAAPASLSPPMRACRRRDESAR